jgi:3-hydroxyisobutyrate dehydrogenase
MCPRRPRTTANFPGAMANPEMRNSTPSLSIGFVGLGVMGAPMAAHLARAGHRLALFDVAPGVAAGLAQTLPGAITRASPAVLARDSDIVVTMVPNGEVVRDLVAADDGLAQGFRAGSLLIDCSSSEPWLTRASGRLLAERGVAMVDAPVSGAQWGAQAAELVFMVGGEAADVERARPLFEVMGRTVFHLGGLGAGHAMKCLNNLVTAINLLAVTEGLAIGKRQGLDPAVMTDVLNASTGMSWVSQTHIRQRVISRSFDDPFKLSLMLKDIGIAMELARAEQLPTPLSALGQQLWRAAALAAEPGASVSELVRWVESLTRTQISSGPEGNQ